MGLGGSTNLRGLSQGFTKPDGLSEGDVGFLGVAWLFERSWGSVVIRAFLVSLRGGESQDLLR